MTQQSQEGMAMPNVKKLRTLARDLKVKNYSRMRKDELVWAIQEAEDNTPCYKKIEDCGITDCLFREECQAQ
jgi:transcription termination factor Rho